MGDMIALGGGRRSRRPHRPTGARRAVVVAMVVAVGLSGAAAVGGVLAPAAGAVGSRWTVVPCSGSTAPMTVSVDTQLTPGCDYPAPVDVVSSDVVLDCRGATIDGTGRNGVGIEVSTPDDVDLTGVTIRNCNVTGFLDGIRVTRIGFGSLAAGTQYDHQLSGTRIVDTTVSGARGVGIYVDGYVTHTTLRHDMITGNGSSGVYLEQGTRYDIVKDDQFLSNGFRENGPGGTITSFDGQQFEFWGIGREGLSVDGSRDNVISSNLFEGNSAGGIFLYRNCGQYADQDPADWFPRYYGADDNTITRNTFEGGTEGVWVASRMAENVLPMDCSQTPYDSGPLSQYDLDEATGNSIRHNTFDDVTYGVRVEDDGNTVTANTFDGGDATHYAVVVGTPERTAVLEQPVTGTVVTHNRSTIPDPSPYRWVDGQTGTNYKDNQVDGSATGWCQSADLPRGPFIFVIAVAADPDGVQLPPPADLTFPTVGAQPACTS